MTGIKEGFLERTVWEKHKTFVLAGPGADPQQTQALPAVLAYLKWSKVSWELLFRHSFGPEVVLQESKQMSMGELQVYRAKSCVPAKQRTSGNPTSNRSHLFSRIVLFYGIILALNASLQECILYLDLIS